MIVYKLQKKFIEKQNLITGELEKPDVNIILFIKILYNNPFFS